MLRLEKIGKTYRMGEVVVPVLQGIDLTILRGDYIAIMGASGSGKSTLMNILGCLEQPSEGHYYFDARDVTKLPMMNVPICVTTGLVSSSNSSTCCPGSRLCKT